MLYSSNIINFIPIIFGLFFSVPVFLFIIFFLRLKYPKSKSKNKPKPKSKNDIKFSADNKKTVTPVNHGELRRNGQIHNDIDKSNNLTGLEKIKDNTVKLEGYQNQFSENIRNSREKPACTLDQSAEVKTDMAPVNAVPPAAAPSVSYSGSSKITPHGQNVLDEMRAAESVAALDALWAKHSNHMPFSDYIGVKREYENIRRNLN